MYGSGLRLLECLTLRVKDIDRWQIVVVAGKGGKDRRTPLAESFSRVAATVTCCVRAVRAGSTTRVRSTGLSPNVTAQGAVCGGGLALGLCLSGESYVSGWRPAPAASSAR